MKTFDIALIELTNVCNFKCPFCAQTTVKRSPQNMPKDMIEKILTEIAGKKLAKKAAFHVLGEPTLHKDFDYACRLAHDLGLQIDLITNGSILTEERIEKLISLPVEEIKISLRTVNDMTFAQHHSRLTFEQYIENIKRLIYKNIEKGARTKITLKAFKSTFFSKLFSKKYGYQRYIDYDFIANLVEQIRMYLNIKNPAGIKKNFYTVKDVTEIAPNTFLSYETIGVWDSDMVNSSSYHNAIIGNCDGLKTHFAILCNGDVVPCCRDYNGSIKLGNVNDTTLIQILSGQPALSIRSALDRNRLPTKYCKRCKGGPTILTSIINQLGSLLVYKN